MSLHQTPPTLAAVMGDDLQITTLPNGLRVATQAISHAKSVTVCVSVGVGNRYETENERGLAHLIEHMLYRGTKTRSDEDIDIAFAEIGAQENACTSSDTTQYHAKTLPEHAGKVVAIFSDLIRNSTFDIKKLKPEKGAVFSEIHRDYDDPEAMGNALLHSKIFGEHPLAKPILGTHASVQSFQPEDLHRFVQKYYRPDNIVISAAGNIDHESFVKMVRDHFGDMPKMQTPLEKPFPKFDMSSYQGGRIRRKEAFDQVQIQIGLPLDIPRDSNRHQALEIYADILGSGPTSRLYRAARKDKGLVYGIGADVFEHEETSVLIVHSATPPRKAAKLSKIICEQMAGMADGITAEELARAKVRLRADLLMDRDDTETMSTSIGDQLLLSKKYLPLALALEKIDHVTLADVNAIATEIAASKLTVATVGDNKSAVPPNRDLQALLRKKPEAKGRINPGDADAAEGRY